MNVNGIVYNPVAGNANISMNRGSSQLASLVLDTSGYPHIAWYDFNYLTYDYQILYVHWAPTERNFDFCVEIEDFDCYKSNGDPILRTITNRAYYTHAFASELQYSNYVDTPIAKCPVTEFEKPLITVEKTAAKLQYNRDEIIVFNIKVANEGNVEATDVMLKDIFSREIEFLEAKPTGSAGLTGWEYPIGTIGAGQSRHFRIKFKLKSDIRIGSKPLLIENTAIVTCKELDDVTDVAIIYMYKNIVTEKIMLVVIWNGIDVKTSEGEAGEEIVLDMTASGGSSPYEITIEWGDDEESVCSEVNHEATAKHTYNSSGDYTVIITLVDSFGKTTHVERTLHIK